MWLTLLTSSSLRKYLRSSAVSSCFRTAIFSVLSKIDGRMTSVLPFEHIFDCGLPDSDTLAIAGVDPSATSVGSKNEASGVKGRFLQPDIEMPNSGMLEDRDK
jgi:hypothetical protein